MSKVKTFEEQMKEMVSPAGIEQQARYSNARDAVSWAWRIAQDLSVEVTKQGGVHPSAEYITKLARELTPNIEADLNRSLELLKDEA